MKRKHSTAGRLGMAAFVLTLVTTCISGGTLAKYASEVTGTGTAVAAKWDVEMKADANATTATTVISSDTFTFNLQDTRDANKDHALMSNDRIAPGSTGSVALQANVKNTNEVKTKVSATIDNTNLGNVPIKFYSDSDCKTEIAFSEGSNTTTVVIKDSIAPGTADATTKVIYWKWDTTSDTEDTAIGKKNDTGDDSRTGTFTIKLTAEQITEGATS